MEATITLHDDDFTLEFYHKLKAFVKGKEVVISIREEESPNSLYEVATEYLMQSKENHQQLLDAINRIDNKSGLVTVNTNDLL
jgi:ferritin